MDTVVDIITPVFGLVIIGYACARLKVIDEGAIRGLSAFVFNVAIPVMLVRTLSQFTAPPSFDARYLVAYFVPTLAIFILGAAAGRWGAEDWRASLGTHGLTASYSNAVLLGIPLILAAFGEAAALPLTLFIACHGPIMLSLASVASELGRAGSIGGGAMGGIWRLFANPILIAVLIGVVMMLTSTPLPGPLDSIAALLASAAGPCALFALGASMVQYRIAGQLRAASLFIVVKLLAHPLLVWLAAMMLAVPPLSMAVVVTLAALPTGATAYLFATRDNGNIAATTTTIFLSTGLSIATLAVVISLMRGSL